MSIPSPLLALFQASDTHKEVQVITEGSRPLSQRPVSKLLATGVLFISAILSLSAFSQSAEAYSNNFIRDLNQRTIMDPNTRPVSEINQLRNAQIGVVVAINQVRVQGNTVNGGTLVGGLVGAVVGDRVSGSNRENRREIQAVSAIAGAFVGGRIQQGVSNNKHEFSEYLIKQGSSSRLVMVTLPTDHSIQAGDHVAYSTSRRNTFITRVDSSVGLGANGQQQRGFSSYGTTHSNLDGYGRGSYNQSNQDQDLRDAYEQGAASERRRLRDEQRRNGQNQPSNNGYGELPPGFQPPRTRRPG